MSDEMGAVMDQGIQDKIEATEKKIEAIEKEFEEVERKYMGSLARYECSTVD